MAEQMLFLGRGQTPSVRHEYMIHCSNALRLQIRRVDNQDINVVLKRDRRSLTLTYAEFIELVTNTDTVHEVRQLLLGKAGASTSAFYV